MTKGTLVGITVGAGVAVVAIFAALKEAERESKPMSVSKGSVIYEIGKIIAKMVVQKRITPNTILVIDNAKTIDDLSQGSTDTRRMKEGLRMGWTYKVKYRSSREMQIYVVEGSEVICLDQDGYPCERG